MSGPQSNVRQRTGFRGCMTHDKPTAKNGTCSPTPRFTPRSVAARRASTGIVPWTTERLTPALKTCPPDSDYGRNHVSINDSILHLSLLLALLYRTFSQTAPFAKTREWPPPPVSRIQLSSWNVELPSISSMAFVMEICASRNMVSILILISLFPLLLPEKRFKDLTSTTDSLSS